MTLPYTQKLDVSEKTLVNMLYLENLDLTKSISSSGESNIYEISPGILAKIYKERPDDNKINKIKYMIENQPIDPNQKKKHKSWMFPLELIYDSENNIVGFTMYKSEGGLELNVICSAKLRKKYNLDINWYFLHVVAYNIISVINTLHKSNYVIGDMKLQNILVNNRGLPTFIDCDSFQVYDRINKQTYFCEVGSEDTTPKELIGYHFRETKQTELQDRFRIGILIYFLLFGEHPYKQISSTEQLAVNELIKQNIWLDIYSNTAITYNLRYIPYDIAGQELVDLFKKCFYADKPEDRPSLKDWSKAIKSSIDNLTVCQSAIALDNRTNPHIYNQQLGNCYWCDRFLRTQYDLFGYNVKNYNFGEHKIFDASNDLAVISMLDSNVCTVQGIVDEIKMIRKDLVIRFYYNKEVIRNMNKTLRNIEIVIKSNCLLNFDDKTKNAFFELKDKSIKVTSYIKVKKTAQKTTPQIIIDSIDDFSHLSKSIDYHDNCLSTNNT